MFHYHGKPITAQEAADILAKHRGRHALLLASRQRQRDAKAAGKLYGIGIGIAISVSFAVWLLNAGWLG